MKMRKTFANIGRQMRERSESRRKRVRVAPPWLVPLVKISAIAFVFSLAAWGSAKMYCRPTPEVLQSTAADEATKRALIDVAHELVDAYQAKQEEPARYAEMVSGFDEADVAEMESLLAVIAKADIDRARAVVGVTSPNWGNLLLPKRDQMQVEFVFRRAHAGCDGEFVFAGLSSSGR